MSFSDIYIHYVFAPKFRTPCINPEHERELFAYILGIVNNHKCTLIRINAHHDHVHALVKLHPSIASADLLAEIKRSSSVWIKRQKLFPNFPGWAREYAALSVSKDIVPTVKEYIINQKEHHKKMSFMEEYMSLLSPEERERFQTIWFDA